MTNFGCFMQWNRGMFVYFSYCPQIWCLCLEHFLSFILLVCELVLVHLEVNVYMSQSQSTKKWPCQNLQDCGWLLKCNCVFLCGFAAGYMLTFVTLSCTEWPASLNTCSIVCEKQICAGTTGFICLVVFCLFFVYTVGFHHRVILYKWHVPPSQWCTMP